MRLRNIVILLVILLAVLGGYLLISEDSQTIPQPEPRVYVWLIDMEDIRHIEIALPPEELSQSFVKEADRTWHFDDATSTNVDMLRWGGGIPLILSGPAASRIITENATEEQLAKFGLTQPRMAVALTLMDGTPLEIKVGDSTPDGMNYYVQAPRSSDVATVDYTWFEVLERLVKEPPYPPPPEE